MADLTARILTPALLERDDLAAAPLFQHLGRNCCACNNRCTKLHAVAADDQNLAELDDFTGFALDLVDLEHVLGGNPVLLATGFKDREHLFFLVFGFRYSDFWARIGFFQSILLIVSGVMPDLSQTKRTLTGALMTVP